MAVVVYTEACVSTTEKVTTGTFAGVVMSAGGVVMVTDEPAAMKIWGDELWLYVLSQAYYIPRPVAPTYTFWWPWLKNYSGEIQVGESLGHENNWFKYIWIDQDLKKQSGH